MDSSTKERLTGALLVVLALVVVVPELLSGRHAPEQGVPPAQNPEDGAPLQTYDVQLGAASAATAAPREVAASAAAQIAAVPPPVTQQAPPPVSAPAELAKPVESAAKIVPKPPAPADTRPAPDKPPQAAVTVKPSATVTPAGKWWVQLGSFASRDNAQHLAQKLRAAGFSIDVSQSGSKGKELFRVRAGPLADRATAAALQARLDAAGEKKSSLVAP